MDVLREELLDGVFAAEEDRAGIYLPEVFLSKKKISWTMEASAEKRKVCIHGNIPRFFFHFMNFTCCFGSPCAGVVDHAIVYQLLGIKVVFPKEIPPQEQLNRLTHPVGLQPLLPSEQLS